MIREHELTDEAWARIESPLPRPGDANGRWRDPRQVVDGSCWKLATGAPWRDVRSATGPGRPAMSGCAAGRPMAPGTGSWPCAGAPATGAGGVEGAHRPHQRPGPPARRRSAAEGGTEVAGCALGGAPGAVDACPGGALGRSRGGLTTKLHLAADARGRPLVIRLTEGQAGDDLRPRAVRPARLARPAGIGGRPSAFDRDAYRQRDLIERCCNRLNRLSSPPSASG